MTRDVDLRGAAAMLHRSYDWMAEHWRRLRAEEGFPSPFVGDRPHGRPWWRREAIDSWIDARAGLQTPANLAQPQPSPANDPIPQRPAHGRAARLLASAG